MSLDEVDISDEAGNGPWNAKSPMGGQRMGGGLRGSRQRMLIN